MICCGIDIGTTNLKVVLVGPDGQTLWRASVPSPRVAWDGGVATDALALLEHLEDLVIAGWREHGQGEPLAAISSAGVGEDGVGLTAELAPTDLAMAWFDTRAAAEARELHDRFDGDPGAGAGIVIEPTRTAAKWLWLARHRREARAASNHWVALTDFPIVEWSGQVFMSETLAARTACYDVWRRVWIEERLAAAGAPPVPRVVTAGTVIGTASRGRLLSAGAVSRRTILVAGGHDHPLAASAVRRSSPRAIVDSMGTADVLYGELPAPIAPSLDPELAFSVPVRGGEGLAALAVLEMSAGLAPFRSVGPTGSDLLADLLAKPAIEGQPTEAPFVPSSAASEQLRERVASLGVAEATILARAALEGCTFFLRGGLERMAALGVPNGPLFATGGWSRSRALVELRASVLGKPVLRVLEPELTAYGAAMLASEMANGEAAPAAMALAVEEVAPRAEWASAYDRLYRIHRTRHESNHAQPDRAGVSGCDGEDAFDAETGRSALRA
jgi:xylulokinase